MSSGILITTRGIAQRRLADDWYFDVPEESVGGEHLTLRELITRIVMQKVQEFKERQQARKFVRALSKTQIDEAAKSGQIKMGGDELEQEINSEEAVATALQAFEDQLYLVIIDGIEQKSLEQQVYLREDSKIIFLRLVMLSGG